MRQVEFKNQKGEEFLFVEVPKDAELIGRMDIEFWSYYSKSQGWGKFLLKGNYKIIAPLSEMTEELWKGVVDWNEDKMFYFKYPSLEWEGDITAKESGESLLKSLQIYLVNPYGDSPYIDDYKDDDENLDWDKYHEDLFKWKKAEQNVGNWIILEVIK